MPESKRTRADGAAAPGGGNSAPRPAGRGDRGSAPSAVRAGDGDSAPRPTRAAVPRTIAFFDMDRTVLRIDSGMSWMRYLRRRGEVSPAGMARALYWSALYKLALLDMETLARRLVADLAGDREAEMIEKCRDWYEADVAHQIAPAAVRAIAARRDRGDVVVLLTGSTQYVAEVVAGALSIEHTLCSRLEVDGGRFTGRLAEICFGRHKVTLADRFAAAHRLDLDRSVFYSDSYNDLPMLERAGEAVAVNPDARLKSHARKSGWRIERWA